MSIDGEHSEDCKKKTNESQKTIDKRARRVGFRLFAQKVGMISLFDEGAFKGCTVLEVRRHQVVGERTKGKDGYRAVQLGVLDQGRVRCSYRRGNTADSKPVRVSLEKRGVGPCSKLFEVRVADIAENTFDISTLFDVSSVIMVGDLVNVQSKSKGKGFQGVMKRHGMKGGPASHGASRFHRRGGSVGGRSTPGRTFKNRPMAGRMGGETTTVVGLEVRRVMSCKDMGLDSQIWGDVEWLVVNGGVPGCNGSGVFVTIRATKECK